MSVGDFWRQRNPLDATFPPHSHFDSLIARRLLPTPSTPPDYDYDMAENMEDESIPELPEFSPSDYLWPDSHHPDDIYNKVKDMIEDGNEVDAGGISTDSWAFTVTYCSVFTISLAYVAFKLAKKWRTRSYPSSVPTMPSLPSLPSLPAPTCGHAHCTQIHQQQENMAAASYYTYTGLGAAWIPEVMTTCPPPVHSSSTCNNSCNSCRRMARPPPSYRKLFLDDNPPSYSDAIVMEGGAQQVEESKPGHDEDDIGAEIQVIREANIVCDEPNDETS